MGGMRKDKCTTHKWGGTKERVVRSKARRSFARGDLLVVLVLGLDGGDGGANGRVHEDGKSRLDERPYGTHDRYTSAPVRGEDAHSTSAWKRQVTGLKRPLLDESKVTLDTNSDPTPRPPRKPAKA